jgi:mannosyltransferase
LLLLLPPVTVVALGLWGLDRQDSLWQDEAVTFDMAHRTSGELWATLENVDAVHGLYYLLMHGVFTCWEGGVLALRLPSVLAMALAAWGVGLLGRRLAGPAAGAMAGLIFAMWPAIQRYTQEGRSYAFVTAAIVWATVSLGYALASSRRRWWASYAILMMVACLLHEFAVLALVAHAVTLAWLRAPRSALHGWGIASACVLLTVAPLVWVSVGQAEQVAWIQVSLVGDLTGYLLLALIALISAAIVRRDAVKASEAHAACRVHLDQLVLPLVVCPPGLLLLASLVKPLYVDRYVLYSLAGVSVLAGAACVSLWRGLRTRQTRAGLAVVVGLSMIACIAPMGLHLRSAQSRSDDATAVAATVQELGAPDDAVIFLPQSRRVWMLRTTPMSLGMTDLALDRSPASSGTLFGVELASDRVEERMLAAERIVVVRDRGREAYETSDQDGAKRLVLSSAFTPCRGRAAGPGEVTVYARHGLC